jgi:misacylated tRNA(Ala) deacylase
MLSGKRRFRLFRFTTGSKYETPIVTRMTETLYLEDPTVRRVDATVERVLDDRVVLDRTQFYPEGGGQPADTGTLIADGREIPVVDVRKKDTIYHEIDGEPPAEGEQVEGDLDWERRYAHMRYHTAQHLLSALCLEEYDAPTRGNQLYTDRARIDVEHDRFTETDLADVEGRLNELVEDGMEVRWYTMDRDHAEQELDTERTRVDLLPDSVTELRIVEIGAAGTATGSASGETDDYGVYDRTACAGTHVSTTEEIGEVTVTGRETGGAGRERLRFILDDGGGTPDGGDG